MTTARPTRRILIHHPNVKRDADRFAEVAEEIDVAKAIIKRELAELDDTREHPDDRAEHRITAEASTPGEPPVIDYADPTGESTWVGRRWRKLTADLEALQDLEVQIRDDMATALAIARGYGGPNLDDEPRCEHCGAPAEVAGTDRRKFRGARQLLGEWVRRGHGRPVMCRGCRAKVERGAA